VAFDLFLLFSKVCAESYTALGTRVPRVIHLALGTGLFAGPAVPSALCREFPLGTAVPRAKGACAESISLSAEVANPVVILRARGPSDSHTCNFENRSSTSFKESLPETGSSP
jgi:hypothetical protein